MAPREGNENSEGDVSAWRIFLIAVPVLALAAFGMWYALSILQPPPQKEIVLSTGSKSGGFHAFGLQYQKLLAREGIKVRLVNSAGAVENLARLKDPKSDVVAALIQGGIGASEENQGLVSIGQMFYEPVWVFYQSDATLTKLSELRGKKIAVGPVGSGTRALATELLRMSNVTAENSSLVADNKDDAVKRLFAKDLDAIVLAFAPEAPALKELLFDPRIKLMSLEQAEALTRLMPYLSKVTLPRGVFDLDKDLPAQPIDLVAPVASLVVREELHAALVGQLAKAAQLVHGRAGLLQKAGAFPVPADAVFAMSEDAERFYKSGQPLLQRYFPFWLANFIERMLVLVVPIATIAFPVIKGIPAFFRWRIRRRLDYWYSRLRRLEAAIVKNESQAISAAHLAEVERIDSAVRRLNVPKAFTEAYYNLRSHVDLVRLRLAG